MVGARGRERRAAVILVTHDDRMLEGFERVYRMIDGRIDTGARIHRAVAPPTPVR